MKNEIILTEEQRTMILEVFNEFSNAEKDLLSICCILAENGVTRRDLLRVLEYEPSDLNNMLNRIVDSGLLIDRGDQIIWCPVEVKRCILPTYIFPTSMLVRITDQLTLVTIPSMYVDALTYKPLNEMAIALIDFIVEMHPENVNWKLFATLVYNYALQWAVYARFEPGIKGREDTLVVRALRLAKENIEKGTAIYTDLISLEAIQFVHAFMYENAQKLIDEIESLGNPITPLFMLAQGYFWETYGEYYRAFYFYYKCYTECIVKGDDFIQPTVCMMISFLTSLLGDVTTSESWLRLVHVLVLPTHHMSRFYYYLINALNTPDEYYAEESLRKAKDCICDINMEAPILARWFYVNSHFYTLNEQPKRSAQFYQRYCHHMARYGSTLGAFYIYQAAEISRLVLAGNQLSCKRRLNMLDRVPLKSPEVAISVQIQVCCAYVDFFMAEENALAKTYCEIALELLEEMKPDEETANTVVNNVFNGYLPSSLFEEPFYFDLMLVKYSINEIKKQSQAGCLSRESNQYQKVWRSIRELREAYPNQSLEIDVLAAYFVALKKPANACRWWRNSIEKAIGKEKYRIGVMAAGYCTEIGYIWEAKDLLQTIYDDSSFLNQGTRCLLLTNLATTMEQCGMRSDVAKIWDDAIALAEGTEFLANVYFAWAVSLYNRAEYAKALKLIDKSLEHYKCYNLEPSIFDETKASILCYRSICLSQEIRYSEAILDIQHAIELWPDHSASSYNLYYNLGYYYLGNHEWSNAKEALDVIKAMPLDKLQKQQVEELYAILRIPLKDRMRYVQSYFGDNGNLNI